jgi:16S rRNA (cytosine1402-N4)-methyltransferase
MVAEILAYLDRRPGGVTLDATVGGGGHAWAILNALPADSIYVGFDRDAAALSRAAASLATFEGRVFLRHESYRDVARAAAAHAGRVANCLFDLGLSADQLADASRGFSFAADGPLDMRLDVAAGDVTAAEVVNTLPEKELADLIFELGQEPRARAVARALVAARRRAPIRTTVELAALVTRATGMRHGRTHAATRTFQALRVFVNDELGALAAALPAAASLLAPGGRLLVLSYHSLEDRTVKLFLRGAARRGELEILTPKPMRPSRDEARVNPRSRSARLRVAARVVNV